MKRRRVFLAACVAASATFLACGPSGPPPPPPPPFVEITNVTSVTPEIGQQVTINWRYAQDDNANYTPKLKAQIVQLLSLTLDGNLFVETQGCLPASLLGPNQQPLPCLPLQNRGTEFAFRGPVMFRLVAVDEQDKIYEKMVKFKLPGMSFKASANMQGNPGYPRYGAQTVPSFENIEFERVFGIFEVADNNGAEDGVIDELQRAPLNQLFPANVLVNGESRPAEFFLTSNQPNETQQFGVRRGGSFPFLDVGFLFNTSEGQQFQGSNRTRADALIFAGTIAVNGTIEVIKTDAGDVEVITPSLGNYEPIFIQIDLRSTDTNPQQIFISDVHFGNSVQGLVFSTFRGHISSLNTPTVGQYTLNVDTSQIPLKSTGSTKGALTGFNVRTSNGQDFIPAQALVSAEWSNIPIFPDNDISGLRSTFIRFTQ